MTSDSLLTLLGREYLFAVGVMMLVCKPKGVADFTENSAPLVVRPIRIFTINFGKGHSGRASRDMETPSPDTGRGTFT